MRCRRCGKLERERLDFMADNPFYTKRFSHYVGRRCRQGTNNLKTQLEAKIQIESAVNPRVCGVCLPAPITKKKLIVATPGEAALYSENLKRHTVLNGSPPNGVQSEGYANLGKSVVKNLWRRLWAARLTANRRVPLIVSCNPECRQESRRNFCFGLLLERQAWLTLKHAC